MSVHADITLLRGHLQELAAAADAGVARRYALKYPAPENLGPYRRMRRALGRVLRQLRLRRPPPLEPWLAGTRQQPDGAQAEALLVWALGMGRDELRRACEGLRRLEPCLQGRAPVLVTDVADFAFFSRLGWLVEYVPAMTAPAEDYALCKQRYLAWRYRDAAAIPVALGLIDGLRVEDLELG